jgi:hypothetical protein
MLTLDDSRWATVNGAYRVPYDPRPALAALENGQDEQGAWGELWENLHHQGDVAEGSYAAVPHLVRIHANRSRGWDIYALIATIEDVRSNPGNPPIPFWLQPAYSDALTQLGALALDDLHAARDPDLIRSALAIVAVAKAQPALARFAIRYTDDERSEILRSVGAD